MCRSGCPTQDHDSWGECARASNIQWGSWDARAAVRWNESEIGAYRDARKVGIQPEGTSQKQIDSAVKRAEEAGRANGYTDNQLAIHREVFGCDPQ